MCNLPRGPKQCKLRFCNQLYTICSEPKTPFLFPVNGHIMHVMLAVFHKKIDCARFLKDDSESR